MRFLDNPYKNIKKLPHILLGVILLFVSSQLTIPLKPIPITMQTVGVMLIGLLYERIMAISIIAIYLIIGALGVPVFANLHAGTQPLFGPTGGYLWGFLVAAIVMTTLKKNISCNNLYHVLVNCTVGTICILLCGVAWFGFKVEFAIAIKTGLYPFIIPGMIKIVITCLAYYLIRMFCQHMI